MLYNDKALCDSGQSECKSWEKEYSIMLTNEYLKRVYDGLAQRNANEPEFLQAVREVLESIQPVVEKHPEYEKAGLIERLVEPERIITFRVPWVDDKGEIRSGSTNRSMILAFSNSGCWLYTSSIERRTSFTACKYSFSPGCFASSADKITSVFIVYNFFLR